MKPPSTFPGKTRRRWDGIPQQKGRRLNWPILTNSLGKQQPELSTRTWSGHAPWNRGKFVRWPIRAVQKYLSQYKNIYPSTKIFIPVQKYLFQYKNIYPSTKIFFPVQKYLFQYKNIYPSTKIFFPVQKYFSQYKNIYHSTKIFFQYK